MADDEGPRPWRPAKERAPPPTDHAPGWKPSAFSWAMGRLILARIEAGETVAQITADPDMPCYATVYRWTRVIPKFGAAWRKLRAEMAETQRWVDEPRAVARAWMRAHARRLAGKPPRDWVSGRSAYTPERGRAVCAAVAAGAALCEVTARPDMPTAKAVYGWLRRFPEFRAAYARACAWREQELADRAVAAAMAATSGTAAAAGRRNARLLGPLRSHSAAQVQGAVKGGSERRRTAATYGAGRPSQALRSRRDVRRGRPPEDPPMEMSLATRRTAILASAAGAGSALLLAGCSREKKEAGEAAEVTATEDLMREHGVLRRILVVYRESVGVLRSAPGGLDAGALGAAAALFANFGETYHEGLLEEQRIFPALRKAGGEAGALVDTLLAQHRRGREITAFVQAKSAAGKIGAADAEPLARALDGFVRMYEAHTAWEDTVVFPAWKKTLSKAQLDEVGDQFEAIERQQFKGDGFDMAVAEITRIEQRLGLHDLGRFTAPPLGAPAGA